LGYKFAGDSAVFFNGKERFARDGLAPGFNWQVRRVDVEIEVI